MTNEISGVEKQPAIKNTVEDGITYESTTNPEANTVKNTEATPKDEKVEQQPKEPAEGSEDNGEDEAAPKKKTGGFKKKVEKLTVENMQKDAEIMRMRAELEKHTKPAATETKEAAAVNNGEPQEKDYENVIDFIKDHQKWAAGEAINGFKTEQERAAQDKIKIEREAAHEVRLMDFVQTTPDYAEKVTAAVNTGLVTPQMEEAILSSSMSEKVSYHLANYPSDLVALNQIAGNPQALKVAINTIEQFITNNPGTKAVAVKQTNATAPISPIGKSASTAQKDFKDMSVDELEAWRYGRK